MSECAQPLKDHAVTRRGGENMESRYTTSMMCSRLEWVCHMEA